jgi:hypothetical protein
MQTEYYPRARLYLLGFCAGFLLLANAVQAEASDGIKHVVFCWLAQPTAENRVRVIKTSRELSSIPGVVDLVAGTALPGARDIVDDSFDVGVVMTFGSKQDMENYLTSEAHMSRVREVLGPLCGRILVYDIAY